VYTNSTSVGAAPYAAVTRPTEPEGQAATVRVRHLEFGPLHHHLLTETQSSWRAVSQSLFFALFWNGIVSVFVSLAWIAPLRRRSLVRNGQATEGTIVSTRERKGRGTTYYAKFRFRNPENGVEIEREMTLEGEADHRAAQPGRRVTVLYSARNPKRAIIYEFSGYKVLDETEFRA
jgi:hypothetical protein